MNRKIQINSDSVQNMQLTDAPLSVPLLVVSINAGHQARSRLASMGILHGEELVILRRDNGGPLLLEVKGTRVALGRGIGCKVIVSGKNGAAET